MHVEKDPTQMQEEIRNNIVLYLEKEEEAAVAVYSDTETY